VSFSAFPCSLTIFNINSIIYLLLQRSSYLVFSIFSSAAILGSSSGLGTITATKYDSIDLPSTKISATPLALELIFSIFSGATYSP